jgi:hypothetical protein
MQPERSRRTSINKSKVNKYNIHINSSKVIFYYRSCVLDTAVNTWNFISILSGFSVCQVASSVWVQYMSSSLLCLGSAYVQQFALFGFSICPAVCSVWVQYMSSSLLCLGSVYVQQFALFWGCKCPVLAGYLLSINVSVGIQSNTTCYSFSSGVYYTSSDMFRPYHNAHLQASILGGVVNTTEIRNIRDLVSCAKLSVYCLPELPEYKDGYLLLGSV